MPYTEDQDPKAILEDVTKLVRQLGVHMETEADDPRLPVTYKAEQMTTRAEAVELLIESAAGPFHAGLARVRLAAERAYREDPVGSEADEIRRNTAELKVGRLIASAHSSGEASRFASDYADRARRAYLDGDYGEAQTYATASVELGNTNAQLTWQDAQDILDAKNPTRVAAKATIRDTEFGALVFQRDVNAARSRALQGALKLAEAANDGTAMIVLSRRMAQASSAAKFAEARLALARGAMAGKPGTLVGYKEPAGSLPGTPTGIDTTGFRRNGATVPS